MLRMLGIRDFPLALLAVGAVLIGVALWQHLVLIGLVGLYLLVRGAIGAASAGRSGRRDRGSRRGAA